MTTVSLRRCSIPGCMRPHKRRGLCNTHAQAAAARGELKPLPKVSLKDRFTALISPEPNTGCWLWLGAPCSVGYGHFNVAPGVQERSHRAAWIVLRGPIPAGALICHRCDNPAEVL